MAKGTWLPVTGLVVLLSGCQSWTVRDIDSLPPTATLPAQSEQGWVEARYFDDVPGNRLANLTALSRFPDNPDEIIQLERLESPTNRADNYGTLVRGYIQPPSTGRYRFFVSGDDETQFLFSQSTSPAGIELIASVPSYSLRNQFSKFSSQTSPYLDLEAEQSYYFEIRHKDGVASDHFSVAWEGPGFSQTVVGGEFLYSYAVGSALYPNDELSARGYGLGYRIGFFDGSKGLPFNAQYPPLDEDQDGIYDNWEVYYALTPTNLNDAVSDGDGDFLAAYDEFWMGTDPTNPDTDSDGLPDGVEFAYGLDPLNTADAQGDMDGDGFTNLEEHLAGTDLSDPEDFPESAIEYMPGLTGQYFAGGNFERFVLARTDANPDFDWGSGSPAEGVPGNVFTTRWLTHFSPPHASGSRAYEFRVRRDDGVRIYVDDALVMNAWTGTSASNYTAVHSFEADRLYPMTIEYREGYGSAFVNIEIVDQQTGEAVRSSTAFLTQPLDATISLDTTGDGIPDVWMLKHGLNPWVPGAQRVYNDQGVTAIQAYQQGLHPWTLEDIGNWEGQVVSSSSTPPVPSVPPIEELPATTSEVTVSWVAPSTRVDGSSIALSEIDAYEISYGQNQESLTQTQLVSNGATSYTFDGLVKGTWYFQVRAIDNDGLRSASSETVSYVVE